MRINKSQLEKIISEELQKESAIFRRAIQRGLAPTKGSSTSTATEEPTEPEPEPEPEPEVEEAPDILAAVEGPQAEKYLNIIKSANKDNFKQILKKIKRIYPSQVYDILESAILKNIFKEQYGQRFNNTTTVGSMNRTIEDISKLINDDDKNDNYWGQEKPFSTFIYETLEDEGRKISQDNWKTFLKTAFPNRFNNKGEESWEYMSNFIDPMFDVINKNYSEVVSEPIVERKIYNRWKLIAGIK
jgi:hypothetical protein